jgi:hypothetical protein
MLFEDVEVVPRAYVVLTVMVWTTEASEPAAAEGTMSWAAPPM